MKRIILIVLFIFGLVVFTSAITATDSIVEPSKSNDPLVNEKANACSAGGTLDGQCDSDLLWAAGWYLIRYEHGIISRAHFPQSLIPVLPPKIEQELTSEQVSDPAAEPDTSCYVQVGTVEFEYVSPFVLSGNDEFDFYWSAGRLMNDFSGWTLWDHDVWSVSYYGDCGSLGVHDPAPDDLEIISSAGEI